MGHTSRLAAITGCLIVCAAVPVTATAVAEPDEFPVDRILFQTSDEDNLEYLGVALCAQGPNPQGTFSVTAEVITPREPVPTGTCVVHRISDIPGYTDVTRSVDARAAAGDYDDSEVFDLTEAKPVLVQEVAESVVLEDSVRNVNVLGVAVQDAVKDNEVPVDISGNQVNPLSGEDVLTVGVDKCDDEGDADED